MLQRMWVAVLAVLLLAGCGRGAEDFTVRIARPPERVMQELAHAGLDGEVSRHFPGLKVERSEPAANEILYTIPGDSSFPAAIHLTFEAVDGGKETVVHAAVDVPAVKVALKGKAKAISEFKVETLLRELVEKIGKKLEMGGDTGPERKELSQLLTGLAVVTNSKQLRLALDMEKNPGWYQAVSVLGTMATTGASGPRRAMATRRVPKTLRLPCASRNTGNRSALPARQHR